jgi:large subunit ribosomal protein L18
MAGHIKYTNPKQRNRCRRKASIRLRLSGTAERPRLSVFRSARYVYAQAIDDTTGRVLAAASELETTLKTAVSGKPKKERARAIG